MKRESNPIISNVFRLGKVDAAWGSIAAVAILGKIGDLISDGGENPQRSGEKK